mmetsp:Transcript_9487/g.26515  ORF Transcript_9487/g.26515 Transcript_9487/m.26515 type:complete len:221 (-) Transcript_9487:173-835(-)
MSLGSRRLFGDAHGVGIEQGGRGQLDGFIGDTRHPENLLRVLDGEQHLSVVHLLEHVVGTEGLPTHADVADSCPHDCDPLRGHRLLPVSMCEKLQGDVGSYVVRLTNVSIHCAERRKHHHTLHRLGPRAIPEVLQKRPVYARVGNESPSLFVPPLLLLFQGQSCLSVWLPVRFHRRLDHRIVRLQLPLHGAQLCAITFDSNPIKELLLVQVVGQMHTRST